MEGRGRKADGFNGWSYGSVCCVLNEPCVAGGAKHSVSQGVRSYGWLGMGYFVGMGGWKALVLRESSGSEAACLLRHPQLILG